MTHLVGVGEDLREGSGDHGSYREYEAEEVDVEVIDSGKAHSEGDRDQR